RSWPRCGRGTATCSVGRAKLAFFEPEITLRQGEPPTGSKRHRVAQYPWEVVLAGVRLLKVLHDLLFSLRHLHRPYFMTNKVSNDDNRCGDPGPDQDSAMAGTNWRGPAGGRKSPPSGPDQLPC